MALSSLRAVAVIEGKDRTAAAFRNAERNLARFRSQAERTSNVMGAMGRLASLGGGILGGVAAGAAIQQSVTRFAAVERQLNRIGVTGDATSDQMKTAAQGLRQLAYESGLQFQSLSEGVEAGVAAGDKLGEVMRRMPHYAKVTQATGAQMSDVVKTGVSLNRHLGISADGMSAAFDSLATAGKEGEFEFKDMANYLPKLLPMAKALGYQGQEGAEKIGALLQTIRAATGTSEEAANALENIFAKMESKETQKNFKEMGVDLNKMLEKARKKGDDLVQTFLKAAAQATKGDLSKLPQLIGDLQFGKGTRGLLQLPEVYDEVLRKMRASKGTVDTDFKRIIGDTQTKIEQTKETIDRFTTAIGSLGAIGMSSGGLTAALQAAAERMENAAKEINRSGIARTVTNTPDRGGGFWNDFWNEIKDNASQVGPRQIEAVDTPEHTPPPTDDYGPQIASLEQQVTNMRGQKGPIADDRRRGLEQEIENLRRVRTEQMTNTLPAWQAGRQWQQPYQPLDHMTIMRQMPMDAYEEHSRRRSTLERPSTGKLVNIPLPQARPSTGRIEVPPADLSTDPSPDAKRSPAATQESAPPVPRRPLPPPGFGFGDMQGAGDVESSARNAARAMADLQAKAAEAETKAGGIATEVEKIGPAGQQAGQQVAASADTFVASWLRAIQQVQQALNSLQAPNLGAAAGASIGAGLKTGKSSGGTD